MVHSIAQSVTCLAADQGGLHDMTIALDWDIKNQTKPQA